MTSSTTPPQQDGGQGKRPTSPIPANLSPRQQARARTILSRGTFREYSRIEKIITTETTGGAILLVATIAALVLANSPASEAYFALRDAHIGTDIGPIHLNLSIGHWAADGLLAVFFFLAGLELKREFITGDLRDPGKALVPVVAAVGGVATPAVIFTLVNMFGPREALGGWAIPAATDIAFAVAVLALIGSHLPSALRTFLLTLAIVDDLIAIFIIAVFYTSDIHLGFLGLAVIPIALFALLATRAESLFKISYSAAWFLLLPLAAITWVLFYNSGIHATIAGVVLAFMVPVKVRSRLAKDYSLAETFEHRFRPLSSGFAVPVFAFFSAGVAVGGFKGLGMALSSTVALGVILGLVCGKMLGIVGSTFLVTRLRHANLDEDIRWVDLLGLSAIAGIGFTVSLLVSELSFAEESPLHADAKIGVLAASLLAAIVGASILMPRNRRYRRIHEEEMVDSNHDGTPDKFTDDEENQTA